LFGETLRLSVFKRPESGQEIKENVRI